MVVIAQYAGLFDCIIMRVTISVLSHALDRHSRLLCALGLVLENVFDLLKHLRSEFVDQIESLKVVLELLHLSGSEDAIADVAAISYGPGESQVADLIQVSARA